MLPRLIKEVVGILLNFDGFLMDNGILTNTIKQIMEIRSTPALANILAPMLPGIMYNEGFLLKQQGRLDEAREHFEASIRSQALSSGTRDTRSMSQVAVICMMQGKSEEALQYLESLRECTPEANRSSFADVLGNIGLTLHRQRKFKEAMKYYQDSLTISIPALGEQHVSVCHVLNNIGNLLMEQEKYPEANEYFQRVLAIRLSLLGDQHPDTAITLSNIGSLHLHQGQLQKAIEFYQKALPISLSVSATSLHVAHLFSAMGTTLKRQGKLEEAIEYLQKAIPIDTLNGLHQKAARGHREIGDILLLLGKSDEAMERYEDSIAICLSIPDNQQLMDTYISIGGMLAARAQPTEAIEYFRNSLAIAESTNNSRMSGNLYHCIAICLRSQGKLDEAIECNENAVAISISLGEQKEIERTWNEIGFLYTQKGNHQEALGYFQRLLAAQLSRLGARHLDAAGTLFLIGQALERQANFEDATEYFLKCLSIRVAILGNKHPDSRAAFDKIAALFKKQIQSIYIGGNLSDAHLQYIGIIHNFTAHKYCSQEDIDESFRIGKQLWGEASTLATIIFRFCLGNYIFAFGDNHLKVADTLFAIGVSLQRKFEEALKYSFKSLAIYHSLGNHLKIADTFCFISHLYANQCQYEDAIEFRLISLHLKIAAFGDQHPDIAEEFQTVGLLFQQHGNSTKSFLYLQKSISVLISNYGNDHPLVQSAIGSLIVAFNN